MIDEERQRELDKRSVEDVFGMFLNTLRRTTAMFEYFTWLVTEKDCQKIAPGTFQICKGWAETQRELVDDMMLCLERRSRGKSAHES
jgi:hypothetical protein